MVAPSCGRHSNVVANVFDSRDGYRTGGGDPNIISQIEILQAPTTPILLFPGIPFRSPGFHHFSFLATCDF